MRLLLLGLLFGFTAFGQPLLEQELIFPTQGLHSHSSSLVELPDGRMLACWYIGSGERQADDVKLQAAYLTKGATSWERPFLLADTPGLPDANPILFMDSHSRLWLMWPVILDNHWESALLKLRIAKPGWQGEVPHWDYADNVLLKPDNLAEKAAPLAQMLAAKPLPERDRKELETVISRLHEKLYNRLGWMPRVHPLELPSGRILVPLYSDTYNLSLIAITDDGGRSWKASDPLVGLGGVQPSLVRRKDGTIVAYMRDNGPPPQRALVSESHDDGVSWSPVQDSDIPNPGSSLEVIALRDGSWCLIHNDTEKDRHRLSVWLSEDEGKSWPWKRALEDSPTGSFSYPSLLQASDGTLRATYSYSIREGKQNRQSIKYVRFNEEWIKQPAASR